MKKKIQFRKISYDFKGKKKQSDLIRAWVKRIFIIIWAEWSRKTLQGGLPKTGDYV